MQLCLVPTRSTLSIDTILRLAIPFHQNHVSGLRYSTSFKPIAETLKIDSSSREKNAGWQSKTRLRCIASRSSICGGRDIWKDSITSNALTVSRIHPQRRQPLSLTVPCQVRSYASTRAAPGISAVSDVLTDEQRLPAGGTCDIKVIDYSDQHFKHHDVSNSSFSSFLEQNPKPQWASNRWIYINGLDRDAIEFLGRHEKLHPLAIEDVLDVHTPTKVDWYEKHCFLEMTLQKLVPFDPNGKTAADGTYHPEERPPKARFRPLSPKKVGMSVEQVSAFLTDDGIVITIFEHSGADIFVPVMKRLESSETALRSSNDPSLLLQSVIDEVVDLALPIGKAIGQEFRDLEVAVLTRPTIAQSEQLYILRSGCAILSDTIVPIGGLIRTLREHSWLSMPSLSHGGTLTQPSPRPQSQPRTTTFISPLAQVYLADVQDHIDILSRSLHMSMRSAENLTSLIFNTIASRQNESVRQLTIVSVFFLPLSFLASYFGMNFDPMPVVNNNSDVFFWYIAFPVMAVMSILILVGKGSVKSLRWIPRRFVKTEKRANRKR